MKLFWRRLKKVAQVRKNRIRSLKISQLILFVSIGFVAGYVTKGLSFPEGGPYCQGLSYQATIQPKEGKHSVCFTPDKRCQLQIIGEIHKAKTSILVQAYSFTDQQVAQALAGAAGRGVKVQVLLDKSNRKDKHSAKNLITRNNIPLRFDSPSGIAHNKVMVIDQSTVLTGSYNFSAAAYTRNTENLLVINNPALAREYVKNWQSRWELSKE